MPTALKFREVIKILKEYDSAFEVWENRGKGSERIIFHPNIQGQQKSIPVKCHGTGTELRQGVLSAIIRRFQLPKDIFRSK
jgi:hypothetical protein